MGKARPIKNIEDIDRLKNYYLEKGQIRNYTLVTLTLNVPIRLEQILALRWEDMFRDISSEEFRDFLVVKSKDGDIRIRLNREVKKSLLLYLRRLSVDGNFPIGSGFIFKSRTGELPIQRSAAYRIIAKGAKEIGLDGLVGFESMRKTIGYQAWKAGLSQTSIMAVYNHPNLKATKAYLDIEEEEDAPVALDINL